MRFKETTLGWFIVCMIVDSFFRIYKARLESFSFAMIFKADFSLD